MVVDLYQGEGGYPKMAIDATKYWLKYPSRERVYNCREAAYKVLANSKGCFYAMSAAHSAYAVVGSGLSFSEASDKNTIAYIASSTMLSVLGDDTEKAERKVIELIMRQ